MEDCRGVRARFTSFLFHSPGCSGICLLSSLELQEKQIIRIKTIGVIFYTAVPHFIELFTQKILRNICLQSRKYGVTLVCLAEMSRIPATKGACDSVVWLVVVAIFC